MTTTHSRLGFLERRRSTLFLVAGIAFVINAAVVATGIATNSDHLITTLGQAFVGVAWTAAFLGLLGLYPGLVERSRWLVRVGGVLVAIGVVVFAAMAVASLLYFAGIPDGEITDIVPLVLPGVILGSVLGFLSFGVASLRTDVHPRSVGILLLVPPLFVIANVGSGAFGIDSPYFILAIVSGLSLVMLATGFRLRSSGATDHAEAAPGRTADRV